MLAHFCSGTTTCTPGPNADTTIFVYDTFGRLAMEYRAETATAGTSYYTRDHLGSTRLEMPASGQQVKCSDFLPFGEEIAAGTGSPPACFNAGDNKVKFTGKERDTETGLDYFMARYFSSAQGRFASPDPLLASARLTDPQTWNRYAYVRNNPVNMVDPDGRFSVSVFQGLKSMFITGDMFNDWFRQNMGITTINDFSGAASLPGYSGPDPALIAYFVQVDEGQKNLAKIEQAKKEEAKKAEALPEGTVTVNPGQTVAFPEGSKVCEGTARVLQGNSRTIGKPGGFSGDSVGDYLVTDTGAAIIPSQWGMSKKELRYELGNIGGVFPTAGVAFSGVVDIVGSSDIPQVQSFLMNTYPGQLIIELPGAAKDYGTIPATIIIPSKMGCPVGTRSQMP